MLLVFDIGNTNITVGMYEGDKLKRTYRLTTKMRRTSDEYGFMITDFLNDANITSEDIEDVIIASVVPKVMHSFRNSIRKYLRKEPIIVGPGIKTGISVQMENPKAVGADRIVDCAGAYYVYGGPALIVDFGTATTFDAIDAQGAYLGGVIYPGIRISMDALFQKAAKLPRVELVKPREVIGKNTVHSLQSGAIYGYVGATENIIHELKQVLGEGTHVVATGGFSRLIGQYTDSFQVVDRHLTLDGLWMIYQDYLEAGQR